MDSRTKPELCRHGSLQREIPARDVASDNCLCLWSVSSPSLQETTIPECSHEGSRRQSQEGIEPRAWHRNVPVSFPSVFKTERTSRQPDITGAATL